MKWDEEEEAVAKYEVESFELSQERFALFYFSLFLAWLIKEPKTYGDSGVWIVYLFCLLFLLS